MTFLEECRKAEDEDRIGQSKIKGKLKAAAATIPSTQNDEITKQLKKAVTANRHFGVHNENFTNCPASTSFRQGISSFGMKGRGRNPHTDRRGDP